MQILSALDAVSPAFSRTKLVLFSPFRWGRTWKFSATAYCARSAAIFLPLPLFLLAFLPKFRSQLTPSIVTAIVVGAIVLTLIITWIFYLCSRLGFVFFDIVLLREQFVAPSWRRHGSASFKWATLKVVAGTLFCAALVIPLTHYMQRFIDFFASMPAPGQPPSPDMMRQIFTFYASFFVVYFFFGIFYFFSALAADFVVPSLALEDITLAEGFRRFGRLFMSEPGQVTLYAIVKLGLGLALYMGGIILLEIVALIVGLIFFLVIFLVGFLLGLLHVPPAILSVLLLFAIALFYLLFLYFFMLGLGALLTFFEAYNLYFLGGRYPMLGDLLEQSTPPVSVATQLPPGPPYSYPPPQIPAQ